MGHRLFARDLRSCWAFQHYTKAAVQQTFAERMPALARPHCLVHLLGPAAAQVCSDLAPHLLSLRLSRLAIVPLTTASTDSVVYVVLVENTVVACAEAQSSAAACAHAEA